jgi:hypothetical protein
MPEHKRLHAPAPHVQDVTQSRSRIPGLFWIVLATGMRMALDRGEHDLPSLVYWFDLCRYERGPDGGMDFRTQVRIVPRLAHGNAYVFVAYSVHSRQEFPERAVHGVEDRSGHGLHADIRGMDDNADFGPLRRPGPGPGCPRRSGHEDIASASIVQATLSVHLSTPNTRRSRDKQSFRAWAVQNPVQFRKYAAPNAASQPACSRLSCAASRVHIGNTSSIR